MVAPSAGASGGGGGGAAGGQQARSGSAIGADGGPEAQQALRVSDMGSEPLVMLGPIVGVMQAAEMSLMDAAVATGVTDMDVHGFVATEFASSVVDEDPHGVVLDEAASITLYTMESELYPTLNTLLRNRDRKQLKPFFPFLKLLLLARAKLPKFQGTVWRGVKGVDLTEKYPKGKEFYWWAFSSTTKQLSTLSSDQFLGKTGTRTIFNIQLLSGTDIQTYSMFQQEATEAEVLIFPGTKFKVIDSLDTGNGFFMVHLLEVQLPPGISMFK